MDVGLTETILRLVVATVAAGAVGLNRDLRGKPIGVRTLGLVGLATAVAVLLADSGAERSGMSDATSRVVQGILTGIGFLGAGVIVRGKSHKRVHNLTSAASVWFTACIGVVSGAGQWRLVVVASVLAFVLLAFGGPIERFFHRLRGAASHDGSSEGPTGANQSSQSSEAGPHQPGK